MEDLVCVECGIHMVNGNGLMCDECEQRLKEIYKEK